MHIREFKIRCVVTWAGIETVRAVRCVIDVDEW